MGASFFSDNLRAKDFWHEASGALGDLGTFVPIVIALTLVNHLDLGTSLIATGIYNAITGALFGVPMPVQPMKSIAAVAIAQGHPLTVPQIMAAGICVSAVTLGLGVTGLIRIVAWIVPLPVVRGIQLSQGLSFAVKAVKYIRNKQVLARDKSLGNRPWLGLDGLLLAVVALVFVVLVNGADASSSCASATPKSELKPPGEDDEEQQRQEHQHRPPAEVQQREMNEDLERPRYLRLAGRVPTALLVFLLGIVLAFVRRPSIAKHLKLGPSTPRLVKITAHDWKTGFVKAAIPQLPLTILNSVVAVCKLSSDLFPTKAGLVSPTKISISVGLMNLVGCWFGVLPVCHGAGGLAGQYKFGATSGLAVLMLGVVKVFLGLVLGSSLVHILESFPVGLLGVLLLFSGVELAMACRDQTSRLDSLVMLACVAVSQATNLTLGCIVSLILYILLKLREPQFWTSLRATIHTRLMRRNGVGGIEAAS